MKKIKPMQIIKVDRIEKRGEDCMMGFHILLWLWVVLFGIAAVSFTRCCFLSSELKDLRDDMELQGNRALCVYDFFVCQECSGLFPSAAANDVNQNGCITKYCKRCKPKNLVQKDRTILYTLEIFPSEKH